MPAPKDYTGRIFNSLTCIERIKENGRVSYIWQCKCGNTTKARGNDVASGHTKTCGKCPLNKYDLSGDYGIGYTQNGDIFYFDKEDYDKIKNFTWSKNSNGYIRTRFKGKQLYFHRFILNPEDKDEVDHIYHNKHDNRKVNLRIVARSQNEINKLPTKSNNSGVRGVYYDKTRNKWAVQITKDGKTHSLGRFKNKNDAIDTRIKKEIELFGEFSPHYN